MRHLTDNEVIESLVQSLRWLGLDVTAYDVLEGRLTTARAIMMCNAVLTDFHAMRAGHRPTGDWSEPREAAPLRADVVTAMDEWLRRGLDGKYAL